MNPSDKIKIVTATIESHLCPTVVVGKSDDGGTIYARYRWGRLVIRLDPSNPPPHGGAAGAWIMDQQLDPEGLAGCISYDEIRELTSELIEWPDELTPRPRRESEATSFPEDYEA
ncbi:MAG: hypothetical protein EAZ82_12235 [Verrucomicrobia bacterium]|nr:MAG: hypothetical protein EAZ82_12235 [Verrucomicrobiota bacterium]